MARVLRASSIAAQSTRRARPAPEGSIGDRVQIARRSRLQPERLAVRYAEQLTRNVHGVSPEDFARTRAVFNDSEVVELTLTVAFFNYFTRYAEGLRLPVEKWALDGDAADGTPGWMGRLRARVTYAPRTRDWRGRAAHRADLRRGDGRDAGRARRRARIRRSRTDRSAWAWRTRSGAMLRVPTITLPWRATARPCARSETIGRDIKLHVSFAVSVLNDCRYCTLHQVLGLRRLGVDPGKLMAMRKDDSALTPTRGGRRQVRPRADHATGRADRCRIRCAETGVRRGRRPGAAAPDVQLRLHEPLHRRPDAAVRRRGHPRLSGNLRPVVHAVSPNTPRRRREPADRSPFDFPALDEASPEASTIGRTARIAP